jgi:hypothetical protein
MARQKSELVRLNYNVPKKLIDRVDTYAENMNVNRTSAINMLVSLALDSLNGLDTMREILDEVKKATSSKSEE